MKYTEEMILRSSSGYCMPFEERGKNVEVTLGYGQQKHPVTGEAFFHHGVDFSANHYLLAAYRQQPHARAVPSDTLRQVRSDLFPLGQCLCKLRPTSKGWHRSST